MGRPTRPLRGFPRHPAVIALDRVVDGSVRAVRPLCPDSLKPSCPYGDRGHFGSRLPWSHSGLSSSRQLVYVRGAHGPELDRGAFTPF